MPGRCKAPPPELLALLAACEARYKAGDKSALFEVLVHCAAYQLPMPEWVRYALMVASGEKARLEVTDWREIFGDLLPRKTQRLQKLTFAKAELLGGDIVMAVAESTRAGVAPDWAAIAKQVTAAHRERTGEVLKLKGGGAKDIYYKRMMPLLKRWLGEDGARILAGNPKPGRRKSS